MLFKSEIFQIYSEKKQKQKICREGGREEKRVLTLWKDNFPEKKKKKKNNISKHKILGTSSYSPVHWVSSEKNFTWFAEWGDDWGGFEEKGESQFMHFPAVLWDWEIATQLFVTSALCDLR